MNGFRKRDHIRFGGVIDRHQRAGLKGGGGGDVQNAAATTLNKAGKKEAREVSEGTDIKANHLHLGRFVQFPEAADKAEPRIIDEHINGDSRAGYLVEELAWAGSIRKILGESVHGAPGTTANFGSDGIEALLSAGGDDEIIAIASADLGKFETYSGGGAGNESNWHGPILPPQTAIGAKG